MRTGAEQRAAVHACVLRGLMAARAYLIPRSEAVLLINIPPAGRTVSYSQITIESLRTARQPRTDSTREFLDKAAAAASGSLSFSFALKRGWVRPDGQPHSLFDGSKRCNNMPPSLSRRLRWEMGRFLFPSGVAARRYIYEKRMVDFSGRGSQQSYFGAYTSQVSLWYRVWQSLTISPSVCCVFSLRRESSRNHRVTLVLSSQI